MREFVVKKVKTLLVPCMCFGLILSTYSTLIDWLRPHADIPLGLRYIGLFINMREYPFPGSLWFLPCLFLVEVILYGLHKVIKGKWAFVASLVLLTCLGIGLHAAYGKGLPWSLDIALLVCGFTALGYWVRNKITCLLPLGCMLCCWDYLFSVWRSICPSPVSQSTCIVVVWETMDCFMQVRF